MVTKTLRIKKVWFEAIASGEKSIEYRADKPFYGWLSTIEVPFKLVLHYQKPPRITKTVAKVELIKRPDWIDPTLCPTDLVWALHLS